MLESNIIKLYSQQEKLNIILEITKQTLNFWNFMYECVLNFLESLIFFQRNALKSYLKTKEKISETNVRKYSKTSFKYLKAIEFQLNFLVYKQSIIREVYWLEEFLE